MFAGKVLDVQEATPAHPSELRDRSADEAISRQRRLSRTHRSRSTRRPRPSRAGRSRSRCERCSTRSATCRPGARRTSGGARVCCRGGRRSSRSTGRERWRSGTGRSAACGGTRRSSCRPSSPDGGPRLGRFPPCARAGVDAGLGRPVRRSTAVRAHRWPAVGRRADRGGPGQPAPDEPVAPGRGRHRQDGGRAARDAHRGRQRGTSRAARTDRGARAAAPPLDHRHARTARRGGHARRSRGRHASRAPDRLDVGGQPPSRAARDPDRRRRHRGRHARAAPGERRLLRPGAGRRGRAAPVRRRAARPAPGQGEDRTGRRTCS